jgi:phosphatidate cytidylyltransferase
MKRLLTALVGVPATILLTLYSPNWLFALIVAVVAGACFEELLVLGAARLGARPGKWVLVLGAGVTFSFAYGPWWVLAAMALAMLVAAGVTTFSVALDEALPKSALAILGIVYCCFLPGFLVLLRPEMVIALLGIVWIGDAAAFYGGRLAGRHLLARTISPKKTVEGAFAGLIGSVVAGVVLGVWLGKEAPSTLLVASFLAGCAGQLGDLAESALKRSAGVKDSSSLLPGHGGMLDRLDSLLFAAPVYYWFFHP